MTVEVLNVVMLTTVVIVEISEIVVVVPSVKKVETVVPSVTAKAEIPKGVGVRSLEVRAARHPISPEMGR